MPRAAVARDIGSIEDVDDAMRTPLNGWRLYNGRDEWFTITYGAIPYYLPPDKGGALDEHPVEDDGDEPRQVTCNGILRVDDRVGRLYKKTQHGAPTPVPTNKNMIYEAAREIVQFAVRNFADRGITFLTDDEQANARRMKEARRAYLASQVKADQDLVATYDEAMSKWKTRPQNANRPLPMPPEPVRLARERLDARDAERRGLMRSFKFACKVCGQYASNDEAKFNIHMAVNHGVGELVERQPEASEPEPVAPKRRGRPPKNAQPAA